MGVRSLGMAGVLLVLLAGCGGSGGTTVDSVDPETRRPPPPVAAGGSSELDREGRRFTGAPTTDYHPAWQPGFAQALRWSMAFNERTTFRMIVPVARAGSKLRLSFRAGDGEARLLRVTVGTLDESGDLRGAPVQVTFDGSAGVRLDPRERVRSDPIRFPVGFREELAVSFEAEGSLAAGQIDLFPGSEAWVGSHTDAIEFAGASQRRAVGLASIEVLDLPDRAFIAIGDSITEAFVDGRDDYREAWPGVAELQIGLPIVNVGVSGQGVIEARTELHDEVFPLEGLTDCIVMVGTNNIWQKDEHEMADLLTRLYEELEPRCTVWAATLPPKDRPEISSEVRRRRRALNEWIRHEADVAGVIDFEAVLRDPSDPDRWLPGMGEDGVHPSVQGQRAIGDEVARYLEQKTLD